jgi:arylsulfatase A-like enzyme
VAKVDNRLVSLTDLYSTIMDMADIPIPRPPTSISLLGHTRREFALSQIISEKLWIKPSASPRMQFPRDYFSPHAFALITAGGLKIIEKRDGPLEIYDLNRDMDESTDLASKLSPEIYETYRGLMDLHKTETGYTRAVLEAEDNGRDQSGMADGLLEKAV